ncbi:MAG: hypothetical protein PHY16_16010 [Methylobacter sp.]|nr:hypothetical protein [Methylobacter sp.]
MSKLNRFSARWGCIVMGLGINTVSAEPDCPGGFPECTLIYDSWKENAGQAPPKHEGSISPYDNNSKALMGSLIASFPGNDKSYGKWEVLPCGIFNPAAYTIVYSDPAAWSYSTSDYFHFPDASPAMMALNTQIHSTGDDDV